MPTNYFQTTQDLLDPSPYILKHSKPAKAVLADNLFRKKLYETPKKDIPALINYHNQRELQLHQVHHGTPKYRLYSHLLVALFHSHSRLQSILGFQLAGS
jgi:hypothetical protein